MTVLAQRQREIKQGTLVRAGGPLIGQEFFWIYDQNGQLWAWWISELFSADWGLQPGKAFDLEVRFYLLPYWVKLVDDDSQVWYLYPDVDGSPLVEIDQPAVGDGITGSPRLRVRGETARYQYHIVGGDLDVQSAT